MATPAPQTTAPEVAPPVQSLHPVRDVASSAMLPSAPCHLPFGPIELRKARDRLVSFHKDPIVNRPRKRPRRGFKARRCMHTGLMRMQHKHSSTPDCIHLKQRCVIYCIYDHSGKTDHMYVGITHQSSMTRYHEHIAAARAWARRPAAARNAFKQGHQLYHTWAKRGLTDFAIFPLEILMTDHSACSSKEFARRFADREAFWINTLKTLSPRGYNVRNDRPTHRQANMLNNEVRRGRKAAARTLMTSTSNAPAPQAGLPQPPHLLQAPCLLLRCHHLHTAQQLPCLVGSETPHVHALHMHCCTTLSTCREPA